MKPKPLPPTSVIPIALGFGPYERPEAMLIVWFAWAFGSSVSLGDNPASEYVCWTSDSTCWRNCDCWAAVGVPPNAFVTEGLVYQGAAVPTVSEDASGRFEVFTLM